MDAKAVGAKKAFTIVNSHFRIIHIDMSKTGLEQICFIFVLCAKTIVLCYTVELPLRLLILYSILHSSPFPTVSFLFRQRQWKFLYNIYIYTSFFVPMGPHIP